MDLRSIETNAVNTWLRAVRLPLTTAEAALRRAGREPSTPGLYFESFEAFIRDRAGSVLRNEDLTEQASLQRAEIEQRRRALSKRIEALATEAEAEAELEEKLSRTAQREQAVEQRADEREAQLERQRAAAKAEAAREAAEKRARAAEASEKRERQVAAKERAAKARQLDAEEKALAEKERALRAEARVEELGKAVETTKARRKSS